MKIIIDIPQDHKRVIDNLVVDGKSYLLPQEVETRLAMAVKIGTVISEGATNGDVIKIVLPNGDLHSKETEGNYWETNHPKKVCYEINFQDLWFDEDWWNAPYKKEVEE